MDLSPVVREEGIAEIHIVETLPLQEVGNPDRSTAIAL